MYLMEKTGAKAKNILILLAIFGIVETVMKPEKKDINELFLSNYEHARKDTMVNKSSIGSKQLIY